MKFTVFWDVAPCSFVGVDRRFSGVYYLHHQGHDSIMEAVCTSEMSVHFNVATRRYIPEDCKLNILETVLIQAHIFQSYSLSNYFSSCITFPQLLATQKKLDTPDLLLLL
jgi:hypothetical protein